MNNLLKLTSVFLILVTIGVGGGMVVKQRLPQGPDDNGSAGVKDRVEQGEVKGATAFSDKFVNTLTLEESGSMKSSRNSNWWLNSGAYMYFGNGQAKSIQGDLPALSTWRVAYSLSNPLDTDNGYHPQNILRLVTRTKWQNFIQQAYFKINKDNLSASPNRNESNGLFLFNRYVDGNNLYYTGLRVDGAVVIKKKYRGNYYTMAYKKVLPGSYNRSTSPNLIPKNQWIGLKSQLQTTVNGVEIKFWIDWGNGQWVEALSTVDNGKSYGGAAISKEGFAGVRTDFIDFELKDYDIGNATN